MFVFCFKQSYSLTNPALQLVHENIAVIVAHDLLTGSLGAYKQIENVGSCTFLCMVVLK